MKKIMLLLSLLLTLTSVRGNCFKFEIKYLPILNNVPSAELLEKYNESGDCDLRFLYAARMIRAFDENDIGAAGDLFRQAAEVMNEFPKGDKVSLRIVYLYASLLEANGESSKANLYYSYVYQNVNPKSTLATLSNTAILGIRNSIEGFDLWKSKLLSDLHEKEYSINDQAVILLKLSEYVLSEDAASMILSFSDFSSAISDEQLKYFYLLKKSRFYSHKREKGYSDIFNKADALYQKIGNPKFTTNHLTTKARILNRLGLYSEALECSEKMIERVLDNYGSIDDILSSPPPYSPSLYSTLNLHALTMLFQTRLGKGLPPVIDAFNIYELNFLQKHRSSLNLINNLVLEKRNHLPSPAINALIVGFYLYNETKDISYLNRSIQVLDRWTGSGNFYWANIRGLARQDEMKGNKFLDAQRELDQLLQPLPDMSLKDIYDRIVKVNERQHEMTLVYPELPDLLEENSKIDLSLVSEGLAKDTSAILCFYSSDDALYRLLVTPDTIEMADLYDSRTRALALTSELQSLSNPRTKKGDYAEASRELYRLLFTGIDSLLTPNVHLIATGELENVPFPALRRDAEGETARYLGTEVAISRQMSIGSMRVLRDQEIAARKASPLGLAPVFANESLQAADLHQAGFVLPPLFYNTDELEALEARGPGDYFYGEEATLSNYQRNVTDHSIIHLATHAISSEIDGLRSRIYLAGNEDMPSELFASDIGDRTLNADLVVLSACETSNGGRHATEGRISLTKAYLAAGARSVVSSNWAVDDFATATLMDKFYHYIQEGKPPHQALRLSRKAYLSKYPEAPPYKWAAFEAYGGMQAVAWDRSGSLKSVLGFGSVAVMLVGGLLYFRTRKKAA
ncbi:CHAT domain-containing protein [Neolewinella aurantiaca]|uniref:CHAT domain-containing protein n=1 Tax=Neolewinella aurantiaca TaxID=2602767 RepID=A0A5C7FGC1_9BACT|nr:CHAT domain-containing protein [Neolewinella aurantiaca]TXF89389.1 CHAT domain-containing protein [Neolewinella aurantiaca]